MSDAFLSERDAHCVRDAASPVMHAFGACKNASHHLSQHSGITYHLFAKGIGMRLSYADKTITLFSEKTECAYYCNNYLDDGICNLNGFAYWVNQDLRNPKHAEKLQKVRAQFGL